MSDAQTYFDLFSLPQTFAINEGDLHRAWLIRQHEFHPDRYLNRPHQERLGAVDAATRVSAELNHAYQVLKNPLERAVYLLQIKGFDIDESQTTKNIDFLDQMMEIQTELSDLTEQQNQEGLTETVRRLENSAQAYVERLGDYFADEAYQQRESTHLENIRQCVLEYKFYIRLLDQGRAYLYELE